MSEYLDVAVRAALEAGAILKEKLGKVGFREKNPADLVTEADVAAQAKIAEIVSTAFPEHYFIGEEPQSSLGPDAPRLKNVLREEECGSGAPADLPFTWIVDPLDGTTNFVHRVPFFGTSIALTRGNEILCGVVYDPSADELFAAERGAGAFLNGERLRTSDFTRPTQALTAVSFPTQTKPDSPDYLAFKRCVPVCQAMRRTGSTALNLAYVAAGRFDAKICQCAHPWDVAAGVLLVLEAGGVATNADGRPFDLAIKPLLATANAELHGAFLKLLND